MRILLANSAFHRVGGSETYLATLGENLVRLGHDVRIYTRVAGDMAMLARRRGLEVVDSTDDLGAPADVVLAQDGIVAHDLAGAWPEVPQAFVCHSSLFDVQQPPLVPGIASTVIVLNDRVRRRVEALNGDFDVVRLTQPIDTQRFSPHSAPRDRPRRALVLSTYLDGAPRQALDEAWGRAGVELVSLGDRGLDTDRLEADLEAYSPELGRLGREIVLRHHDARRHAHDVLDVLTRLGAGHGRTPTLESELARQVRLRWGVEAELFGLRAEMRRMSARADALEDGVEREVELARQDAANAREELATVLAELEKVRERVDVLQERLG